ncbi:MAG TPA: 3-deoxy-manno-octulosonate cytidylyltransferase [Gammaproteobacteria bacterium]|nr:3-deoxy-manno-octulosonate cytidylyltransferase [Gammaproteobacteria bacterium]
MKFRVVIPARHGATRLPGKPLRILVGRPMIWHVYQRAVESGADQVVIATDHRSVMEAGSAFGAEVCMTSRSHRSGSDRIAEVAEKYGWADTDIVVNLQGDEPTMPSENVARVAENLAGTEGADITTLCTPVGTVEELLDPNVVKVVRDARAFALYFSRAPVPWNRDGGFSVDAGMPPGIWYRHIGLYAYRVPALRRYTQLDPCELENKESLEQLRALWHGMRIHVGDALALPGIGVDTEADLERVEQLLREEQEA